MVLYHSQTRRHVINVFPPLFPPFTGPGEYKIQETLFNVGFHKQITLATRAIFRQTRV